MSTPFRTIVEVKPFPFQISYNTPLMMFGSCFAENIGGILRERKFPVVVNPNGVVYNPLSVALVLQRLIENKKYNFEELVYHNNLWLSLNHHTSFSKPDKASCLNTINESLNKANVSCEKMQYLMITFGTARVYYYNATGLPVANCHKIPAKEFTHKILSVGEIVDLWFNLLNQLFLLNPNLRVILTVSPVRHWKDGAVGNQISKSTLILAVNQLVALYPSKVFYFPAYEIMMDDLRDYRFYADDMLHPSNKAVDYIWSRFSESVIDPNVRGLMKKIEKILLATNHKQFNPFSTEYKIFLKNIIKQIEAITMENSSIDFTNELLEINDRLVE